MAADTYGSGAPTATLDAPSWQQDRERGLGHLRQLDPGFDEAAFRELCTDRFFQIQAAWMRRDLDKLRPLLTEEMQGVFGKQLDAAKAKRQLNKLENITVRSVELTEAWQEQGQDYITVRLLANLLDYTVDETTGTIVDGQRQRPGEVRGVLDLGAPGGAERLAAQRHQPGGVETTGTGTGTYWSPDHAMGRRCSGSSACHDRGVQSVGVLPGEDHPHDHNAHRPLPVNPLARSRTHVGPEQHRNCDGRDGVSSPHRLGLRRFHATRTRTVKRIADTRLL